MKAVKVTVGIFLLLAIVIGGVMIYALNNLNGFVESVIEDAGSQVTQTAVRVGGVNIQLSQGSGAIYGLSIANPKGYSGEPLFKASSIGLSLNVGSVTQPVKVIEHIDIGEISLRVEQKGIKDSNVESLLDNIKKSSNQSADQTPSSGKGDVRIMIEKITFAESSIDLQTEKLGSQLIPLPSFLLTNIGDKKSGVTPQQAGEEITRQLMKKVKAAVSKELKSLLSEEAKAQLKEKVSEKLKSELSTDKLKSLFK